jgi:hypothetical protein
MAKEFEVASSSPSKLGSGQVQTTIGATSNTTAGTISNEANSHSTRQNGKQYAGTLLDSTKAIQARSSNNPTPELSTKQSSLPVT